MNTTFQDFDDRLSNVWPEEQRFRGTVISISDVELPDQNIF
jgi:hypothetical protein